MGPDFGTALAGLRHDRGLNQRQLAAELKISQALLSHYENGTREPGLPFICRVCDYFGVSADYLLGREGEKPGSAAPAPSELQRALSQLDPELRDAALTILHALTM